MIIIDPYWHTIWWIKPMKRQPTRSSQVFMELVSALNWCWLEYFLFSVKFTCEKCNKVYKTQSNLNSHVKEKHGKDGPQEKLSCKYCGKVYVQKSGLQRHIRRHHDPEDDDHKSVGTQTPYCYDSDNSWVCAVYVPGRQFPCGRHFEFHDHDKKIFRNFVLF